MRASYKYPGSVSGAMNFRAIAQTTMVLSALLAGCAEQTMKPIASVEEGVRLVDSFKGEAQDFELAVPESLLDPVGINMSLITDRALARGWEPDGFVQSDGYRVFRYRKLRQ